MKKILALILICLVGCREPFDPVLDPTDLTVLVVEGYLDTEGLSSTLKLSYTQNIQTADSTETGFPAAIVYLRSEAGEEYPLTGLGNGLFEFKYDIPENENYRLHIISDNRTYTSDLIKPIITPEIIEVGFDKIEEGIEIFLTTQGDENADDFLWTFEETYSFRPKIPTGYVYDVELQDIRFAKPEERTDLCYRGSISSDLILETSSKFENQFVFRQAITRISNGDERLSLRYSILISQKAIDKKAAEFWEILRKNSDDLGSIFSPLPSNISGNIKNDQDPKVPVIGYVSLGKVRQRRFFIDVRDVAPWRAVVPDYYLCIVEPDTVRQAAYDGAFRSGNFVPVVAIYPENAPGPIGYQGAARRCTDCTLRGTREKPDFWDN